MIKTVYLTSLIISIAITLLGAIWKILHLPGASPILSFGLFIGLIYIVIALIEIFKTESKTLLDKLLWLVGFILVSWITGLIYYNTEFKKSKL